ncbi:MAG: hypothetical protein HY695_02935 [Deltaproteobacteria bacterium]|nr:hypothetical protein [Deltaproteobacteria bacterium]
MSSKWCAVRLGLRASYPVLDRGEPPNETAAGDGGKLDRMIGCTSLVAYCWFDAAPEPQR